MRVKDSSVSLAGCCPQILWAVVVADQVIREASPSAEAVVTSASDGRHSQTSLHYAGSAVDLRSRNLSTLAVRVAVRDQIKACLGPDFDVLLEDPEGPNEHFHIEWQPKRRP